MHSHPREEPHSATRHLLGWQGITLTIPITWNLAAFEGDARRGVLRVADDEAMRLELLWEQARGQANVEHSIDGFLARLKREAGKQGHELQPVQQPKFLPTAIPGKAQVVTFGWTGKATDATGSQGWGVAWLCDDCGRVVVASVVGRPRENRDRLQRQASEILGTLQCHGEDGWQTWSVFDLRLQVPQVFELSRAKLLTGRIELGWSLKPKSMRLWSRSEEIGVRRLAAANVLLAHESLEQWACRVVAGGDRKRSFEAPTPDEVHGHAGWMLRGHARDPRRRVATWIGDRLLKRHTPPAEVRVWHCADSNKLFVVDGDMLSHNQHIMAEVVESVTCH